MSEAIEWIKEAIKKGGPHTFDYETNAIKPHREWGKILCMSFSDGACGYAFPNFDNSDFRKTWRRFLTSKRVKLIAQNIRFEEQWCRVKFGCRPQAWFWDTQIAAHCINNQMKTQLKLLVYLYSLNKCVAIGVNGH